MREPAPFDITEWLYRYDIHVILHQYFVVLFNLIIVYIMQLKHIILQSTMSVNRSHDVFINYIKYHDWYYKVYLDQKNIKRLRNVYLYFCKIYIYLKALKEIVNVSVIFSPPFRDLSLNRFNSRKTNYLKRVSWLLYFPFILQIFILSINI